MGYDFHITKAADWGEAEEYPIDRQKWLSLAVGSPALVQSGKIHSRTEHPARTLTIRYSGCCELPCRSRWVLLIA